MTSKNNDNAKTNHTFTDANFPKDADGRTYHVGTMHGDTAPRVITVGDSHRAYVIAQHLDQNRNNPSTSHSESKPAAMQTCNSNGLNIVTSKRGFMTITGTFKG
jgi:uridine phosphorylase